MEKKYIDAETFKRRVMESAFVANRQPIYDIAKGICEMVDFIEPADVAPVVHGEWLDCECHNDIVQCSVCGDIYNRSFVRGHKYCNCGAKMDGGEHGTE